MSLRVRNGIICLVVNNMLDILYPRLYLESIYYINGSNLWQLGIRGLIFDLDNTIVPWQAKDFSPEMTSWLLAMKAQGFKLSVVSNARSKRVSSLLDPLGIPAIALAGKPARRAFKMAMAAMETKTEETAVIGDQLFTDILGGNRLGLFTILVNPLSTTEFLGTKLMRNIEKIFLKKFFQR